MENLITFTSFTLTAAHPGLYWSLRISQSGSRPREVRQAGRRKAMQVSSPVPNAISILPRQTTYLSSTRSLR